jgi:hypothetical protein
VIHDPGHAFVESVAAAILVAGGVLALFLAGRARLAGGSVTLLSEPPVSVAGKATTASPMAIVVGSLSVAAAVIHFAAAPAHLEELGPLGLGFVVAGTFQAAWALAWLIEPARGIAAAGLAGNVAILAVWAWSRSAGLPGLPAEPIAAPDAAAGLFEAALVGLLVARSRFRRPAPWATVAVVPAVGIVFLVTVLALSSPSIGHAHDEPGVAGDLQGR